MDDTYPQSLEMEFFKALSNLNGLKVAGLLSMEVLTLEEMANRLRLSRVEINRQLDKLNGLGLVIKQDLTYRLDTSALEAMRRQKLSGRRVKINPEDLIGEDYDRKVLSDFLNVDGSLKTIPMQHKKKLAILRHILKDFEPGVCYPEKLVNELLRRYNEDTASLRRYLVDEGMLKRESGIYWRT